MCHEVNKNNAHNQQKLSIRKKNREITAFKLHFFCKTELMHQDYKNVTHLSP